MHNVSVLAATLLASIVAAAPGHAVLVNFSVTGSISTT